MKRLLTLMLVMTFTVAVTFGGQTHKPGSLEKSIKKVTTEAGVPQLAQPLLRQLSRTLPNQSPLFRTTPVPYTNEMLSFIWDMTGWEYQSRNVSVFDNNNFLTDEYMFSWDTNGWVNSSHSAFTNNANGDPVEGIMREWDADSLVWIDFARVTYTYDANNLLTQGIVALNAMGTWIDFMKITISYNAQDLPIENLIQMYDMMSMSWQNDELTLFTYTTNDLPDQEVIQYWDGQAWENSERTSFSYNNDDLLIEDMVEYWMFPGWDTSYRMLYTHNTLDNLIEIKEQVYNFGNWEDSHLSTGTYDGQGNILEWLYQYWDGTAWENDSKDVYNYAVPIGVSEMNASGVTLSVYPNPAISMTNVSFSLNATTVISVNIHDLTGRVIESQSLGSLGTGTHTTTLNTASLPQGYYFVTLTNGSNIISKEKLSIVK